MIYIIDHQDSFTFNLAHLLGYFDDVYVSNYFEINENILRKSSMIVFSPGPGEPRNYPKSISIYQKFKGNKKILGICLGFQQILFSEKGRITQQKNIYHGFQSKVKVLDTSKLYEKNRNFIVGRYHSLNLKEPFHSRDIKITMRCNISNLAMAFEDHTNKIFGFQFHPESFLTKNGKHIIQKIISA